MICSSFFLFFSFSYRALLIKTFKQFNYGKMAVQALKVATIEFPLKVKDNWICGLLGFR